MSSLPTTPTSQTAGQPIPAATINNHRDNLNFLLGQPGLRVRPSAVQAIANSTWVALQFDVEDEDDDNAHVTTPAASTTRLTCVTPGLFLVSGMVTFAGNAAGSRFWQWAVNAVTPGTNAVTGTEVCLPTVGATTLASPAATKLVRLGVGDYLELYVNQTSGGSLNTVVSGAVAPYFDALWVRS